MVPVVRLFRSVRLGHRTILLRLSAVLRNAVVMCRPLITPDNCWHNTTWPEFQPSLPPGLVKRGAHLLLQTRVNTLNQELGTVF